MKKAKDPNKKSLWQEFKEFISRGSILDMAVGVVIGGAFSAIVTAVVNILLSLCTWAVPGGLNGLVTVLPALTDIQKGFDPANGLVQEFAKSDLQGLATGLAKATYGDAVVEATPTLVESMKSTILSKYTLYGDKYVYNLCASINWGAVINAVISFLIVAATLFIIVKVANGLKAKRIEIEEKAKAAYLEKHPEEAPVEEAPAEEPAPEVIPEPTTNELLGKIITLLEEKK